jgi:hypothetical protein
VSLNVLYFLIFILISSYLFFSRYLDFCEKYINSKNENKNKVIEKINNIKWKQEINRSKNNNCDIVIDVECEIINDKNKVKGYLQ